MFLLYNENLSCLLNNTVSLSYRAIDFSKVITHVWNARSEFKWPEASHKYLGSQNMFPRILFTVVHLLMAVIGWGSRVNNTIFYAKV